MCKTGRRRLLMLCALVCAGGSAAQADAVADFYKGRTRHGRGVVERGRRLRHAGARGRAPHRQASAGPPGVRRAQHARRRRHGGEQFPLHQRRQGRQRHRAGAEQHPVRAAVRHQGGALRPGEIQLARLAQRRDRHGAALARGAGEFHRGASPAGGRGRRLRRQLDAGVLHPAAERDARHPDESRSTAIRARTTCCSPWSGASSTAIRARS